MENNYVSSKEATDILGVCKKTLHDYDKKGKIETLRTEGGWRRYNIKKYLKDNNIIHEKYNKVKKNIIYGRVSSHDRKDDLERQVNYLLSKYPNHEVIKDIGSGINFKRSGLKKIIDYGIKNELNELVLTYKDRLCRIGYELIENILKEYSNTTIIIENNEFKTPTEEITEDLIEIITVYSSKIYGKRSNKILPENEKNKEL